MNLEQFKIQKIENYLMFLCSIFLLLAISISFFEIILRVFFKITFDIVIDLSIWLIIWATVLPLGILLLADEHVSIDMIKSSLKANKLFILEVFNNLCVFIYGVLITIGSVLYVKNLFIHGQVFPRCIDVPMWIVELSIPLGAAFFTIAAFFKLLRILFKIYL